MNDFGEPNEQAYECKNCGKDLSDKFREDEQPKEDANKIVRVQQGGSTYPADYDSWWFCDMNCLINYVYKTFAVEDEREGALKHLEMASQFLGQWSEETEDKIVKRTIPTHIDQIDAIEKEIKEIKEGREG